MNLDVLAVDCDCAVSGAFGDRCDRELGPCDSDDTVCLGNGGHIVVSDGSVSLVESLNLGKRVSLGSG